ncbi:MAG: amidohydrolase family protein, partial [Actinobacteria bacterium]|nr:amidohydrolase family protein [Actinomycetota bacterium]
MSMVIDNIGQLVTNDPALGHGPLGLVENASLVIENETVVSVGPAGQSADQVIDAAGACVLPGFVDSHTHLVFAGDRAQEFTTRMAGQPYDGGGIRLTTQATREASDDQLRALTAARIEEARQGGTTTVEIKSGYGLNVDDEARTLRLAAEFTPDTTFLGAHLLPAEYTDRADDYIDLVCGDMLAAC